MDALTVQLLSCPRQRFVLELEFVELLANVRYLQRNLSFLKSRHFNLLKDLAQTRVLLDERFIHYLKYLQYWRKPEYVVFIQHPHALYFLELLLKPEFRAKLLDPAYVDLVHDNQYWHWRYFKANRAFELQ
jgi:mediator of RNA polymerase II transcription subunit 31